MPQWIVGLFHFRNFGHEMWFFMSVGVLALMIMVAFFVSKQNRTFLLLYPAGFHLTTSIMAVIEVALLKGKSGLFSTDCVWFNALMAGIYAIIFLAFSRRKKKA